MKHQLEIHPNQSLKNEILEFNTLDLSFVVLELMVYFLENRVYHWKLPLSMLHFGHPVV